ncbi:MAG TPA: hypothetical protein VF263_07275 [Longimicrobiaceae bacterium]
MRKPVSKHALRRALERVQEEGLLQWSEPTGAVVDRIWHEMEKGAFAAKKPNGREAARRARATAGVGAGPEPGVEEAETEE